MNEESGDLPDLEIARESERMQLPMPRPRVDIERMAGQWLKTNDKPQWIGRVDVAVDGDDLVVQVFGGGEAPSPADWGTARSEILYAGTMQSGDALAGAFLCHYELPGMSIELQANLNLGLLVVATYVTFREPDALSNRFTREFFRIAEAQEADA
jgi:hypothetical protein